MHRLLFAFLCVALACCASVQPPSLATPPSAPNESVLTTEALTWSSVERMAWPAPQDDFVGYGARVRTALWTRVYNDGGRELYCRASFTGVEAREHRHNAIQLQLEHVYPADSIAEHFGYTNRTCAMPIGSGTAADQRSCQAAAADLYNLFPAYAPMNQSRGNLAYAELAGEGTTNVRYRAFCSDFERGVVGDETYVEPDDDARGDIARALLYMHFVYALPIETVARDRDLLLAWANADPADAGEIERERRIRRLQSGSWNPLVLPPDAQS